MYFSFIIKTVILLITSLVIFIKFLYNKIFNLTTNNLDNNCPETTNLIVPTKKSFKRCSASFNNISYLDSSPKELNIHIPIQKLNNECFRCNTKLSQCIYRKDFFAFDKQICQKCWYTIENNLTNKNV